MTYPVNSLWQPGALGSGTYQVPAVQPLGINSAASGFAQPVGVASPYAGMADWTQAYKPVATPRPFQVGAPAEPAYAGNADRAALRGDVGYGPGMTGAETAAYVPPGGTERSWWDTLVGTREAPGMGGLAIGGISALGGLYLGLQQYNLAKETLANSKSQFERNFAAQKNTTNANLDSRQNLLTSEGRVSTDLSKYKVA